MLLDASHGAAITEVRACWASGPALIGQLVRVNAETATKRRVWVLDGSGGGRDDQQLGADWRCFHDAPSLFQQLRLVAQESSADTMNIGAQKFLIIDLGIIAVAPCMALLRDCLRGLSTRMAVVVCNLNPRMT